MALDASPVRQVGSEASLVVEFAVAPARNIVPAQAVSLEHRAPLGRVSAASAEEGVIIVPGGQELPSLATICWAFNGREFSMVP